MTSDQAFGKAPETRITSSWSSHPTYKISDKDDLQKVSEATQKLVGCIEQKYDDFIFHLSSEKAKVFENKFVVLKKFNEDLRSLLEEGHFKYYTDKMYNKELAKTQVIRNHVSTEDTKDHDHGEITERLTQPNKKERTRYSRCVSGEKVFYNDFYKKALQPLKASLSQEEYGKTGIAIHEEIISQINEIKDIIRPYRLGKAAADEYQKTH